MNDLELEPLPDDVLAALGDAPVPALPPGVAEAVLAKVKVSAGLAAVAAASNAASQSVSSTTVAAKGGVSVLLKVLPVLTLTAGVGLGVAADRFVFRPNSVTERVVVERVEVPAAPVPEVRPSVKAPPKKVAAVDTLGRERVLLDLARSALSSGDVAKALAAVQSHETQFPAGQLTEEREALAVQILWTAGRRDEATRRLHAFSLQFADSPLRPSLDAMMR
ncbi:MAG: hypothetical protein GQE15_11020 [Archangiaceae bacterium]|nr:hypothetical protein [Archangiaceae bacterium]